MSGDVREAIRAIRLPRLACQISPVIPAVIWSAIRAAQGAGVPAQETRTGRRAACLGAPKYDM
jgi:hypothetical protein